MKRLFEGGEWSVRCRRDGEFQQNNVRMVPIEPFQSGVRLRASTVDMTMCSALLVASSGGPPSWAWVGLDKEMVGFAISYSNPIHGFGGGGS
ncbi:hypothetical protein TIFTF001_023647 [Ficus carica]|uniref:Uncharacterized protein n=1 Tax=Ficus carica TaxID=3494 RepID=A0AA88AV11_FICCA|nr:hypothetical protein TIFTF001_023647 [Ficus carica]